jgi:protein-tyrosine phosphatase
VNALTSWTLGPGVVELPDGARLRGRGLRKGAPPLPSPEWALYLRGRRPARVPWPSRWLRWPDFWLPLSVQEARSAFEEAHRRAAAGQRVEIACGGGIGRTGTALACIAQLGGVSHADATAWVRAHYNSRAVETPWQQRYVRRFAESSDQPL